MKCRLQNSIKVLKVKYSRKATSKLGGAIFFPTNYERIEDKRCETNDIIPNINLHNHEKNNILLCAEMKTIKSNRRPLIMRVYQRILVSMFEDKTVKF